MRRVAALLGFVALLLTGPVAPPATAAVAAQVSGTVTDTSGAVVQGATVQALVVGTVTVAAQTTTDVHGFYSLTVDEGTYDLVFSSSTAGLRLTRSVTGATTLDVTLLPATVTVSGVMRRPDGSPAAGLFVEARTLQGGSLASTRTDASGHYSFTTTPQAEVTINVREITFTSSGPIGADSFDTRLTGLTSDRTVDVDLPAKDATVTVNLTKPDGTPTDARTTLNCVTDPPPQISPDLITDRNNVGWSNLTTTAGTITFTVRPSTTNGCQLAITTSTETITRDFTAGAATVLDITTTPPVTVSGVMRRPDGSPAAGLFVEARTLQGGSLASTRTDASGHYSFTTTPQAEATITIREVVFGSNSSINGDTFDTRLTGLTSDRTVDVDLPAKDATVTVNLTKPDGTPTDARTTLNCVTDPPPQISQELTTTRNNVGYSSFPTTAGTITFTVRPSTTNGCQLDITTSTQTISRTFTAGQTTVLDITTTPLVTVSGVMRRPDGSPAGLFIEARTPQGTSLASTRTDASGRYSFTTTPQAEVTLNIREITFGSSGPIGADSFDTRLTDVISDRTVDVDLPAKDATVTVNLTKPDGTPTDAPITLNCLTDPPPQISPDLTTTRNNVGWSNLTTTAGTITFTVRPSTTNGCQLGITAGLQTLNLGLTAVPEGREITVVLPVGLVLGGSPTSSSDGDNVSNLVETFAPNNGDGNNDGTPDADQANVTSLPTFGAASGTPGDYVTVAAPAGTTLQNVSTIDPTDTTKVPTPPPAGVTLPEGLTSFVLQGVTAGGDQTISIYTASTADVNGYAKYDPVADTWSLLPPDRVTVFADHVEVRLTDGGIGDADGVANGSIDDPGGLATVTSRPQTITVDTGLPTSLTYGQTVTVAASATSGQPVTLTASGACTGAGLSPLTVRATGVGTCSVTATRAASEGWLEAAPVTTTQAVAKALLTVRAPSATVQYSDALPTLTGVTFDGFVNGDTAADAVTGTATCSTTAATTSGKVTAAPGTYPVTCTGLSAASYTLTVAPGTLTVDSEDATVSYTGPTLGAASSSTATTASVTLRATVTQATDGAAGDLTKAVVVFDLFGSSNTTGTPDRSVTAPVTAAGAATATASLPLDTWTVTARLSTTAPAWFAGPTSDVSTLTTYAPTTALSFGIGAGTVVDPSTGNLPVAVSAADPRGVFGLSVRAKAGSTVPQGQFAYAFKGADGNTYVVRTASGSGTLTFGATSLALVAPATVTVYSTRTGALVASKGGTGYTVRVDATDRPTGTADTLAVLVTKGGQTYHQVGTTASPRPLTGGSLTVVRR